MGADPLSHLPLAGFAGRIHMIQTESAAALARRHLRHARLVGLDTESRPSFRKGEIFPIALVQIATETDVFLFRVRPGSPHRALKRVIEDPAITKIVQGAPEEIRELRRDLGVESRAFVDLPTVARKAGYRTLNLRALAAEALGIRISKSAQRSDWSREDLSRQQIEYAATDAWACLAVYQRIEGGGTTRPADGGLRLRVARRGDGAAVSDVLHGAGDSPPGTGRVDRRSVRRWLGTRGCGILLAELDGRAAAFLTYTLQPGLLGADHTLWIGDIAVSRDARGRSVGRELVVGAIERARTLRCARIAVTADKDDQGAHELYRDAGLREEGPVHSMRLGS